MFSCYYIHSLHSCSSDPSIHSFCPLHLAESTTHWLLTQVNWPAPQPMTKKLIVILILQELFDYRYILAITNSGIPNKTLMLPFLLQKINPGCFGPSGSLSLFILHVIFSLCSNDLHSGHSVHFAAHWFKEA